MKKSGRTHDPEDMQLSDNGLKFILDKEGFVPKLYNDGILEGQDFRYDTKGKGLGNCTIGYGLLIHPGPCDGRENEKRFKNGIDKPTALLYIQPFIDASEKIVQDNVKVKLTQSQFDSLISYIFNTGDASEAIKLLNDGKYYEAAIAIDSGPYTGVGVGYMSGLEKRRHEEATMFLSGP